MKVKAVAKVSPLVNSTFSLVENRSLLGGGGATLENGRSSQGEAAVLGGGEKVI